ncbi:MAG: zinc-binding dehydrogenase [Lentisphaerae bacterium]|nr:zinc-binding dehydrogenase [Lentisphaerota bacterium]
MKTLAVRLYGRNDLRLDSFELPRIKDDEILADIVSDSICMSSHKAAIQGEDHKRVPSDVAKNPIIIGHEFCGTILEVGARWKEKFQPGRRYSIQPAMNVPGRELEAPGYSFRTIGGAATRIIIPREVMEMDCLLPYDGDAFFKASLSEPVSCIIGGCNTQYHYKLGEYTHTSGIVAGGRMAILAGAGPMGLGAIDYALNGPRQPSVLVVTDIDNARLSRAESVFSVGEARRRGVELKYLNTASGDAVAAMMGCVGGAGYDDVFVYAPVPALIEQASRILGFNGCLNFFAGPSKKEFFASINFYDVHYMGHHVVGSSGGNTADMREALDLMGRNKLNPAVMITHVGGLDCVVETTLNLPKIPGGKKLVYTNISMPLTALDDLPKLGETDPVMAELAAITKANNGLWSAEAEKYLLAHAKPIAGAAA